MMIMKDNLTSKSIKCCEECYSANSRVTPLLNPERCLKNHTQYICGTCGRCICIEKDSKRGLMRWNFPFKTLEIANLIVVYTSLKTTKIENRIKFLHLNPIYCPIFLKIKKYLVPKCNPYFKILNLKFIKIL